MSEQPDRTPEAMRWLRRSYRLGAVVDGVATLEMLFPDRLDVLGRFRAGMRPDQPGFRYGMRSGAALMASWTALLIWADRDPLARKEVLPLTMAVVVGLMVNDAHAVRAGRMSAARIAPVRALQLGLLVQFGASYCGATRRAKAALRGRGCPSPGEHNAERRALPWRSSR